MPSIVDFVLAPADEKQLFDFLAPFGLLVYPERAPAGYVPFVADGAHVDRLVDSAYYLAAESIAPLITRPVKRGRDKGTTEVVETASPVLHYERSVLDEEGCLRAGRLWTWMDLGEPMRHPAFSEAFRRMWLQIRDHLHARHLRSQPKGWVVGAAAARLSEGGLVLKAAGRKGGPIKPYK